MRNPVKPLFEFLRDYAKGIPLDWLIWTKSGNAFVLAVIGAIASEVARLLNLFGPAWQHDLLLICDTTLVIALSVAVWPLFSWSYHHEHRAKMVVSLIAFMVVGAGLGAGVWAAINREPLSHWGALNPRADQTSRNVESSPVAIPIRVSLRELFENGWPDLAAYYNVSILQMQGAPPNTEIKLAWRLDGDFAARSKFLEFFIESTVPSDEALSVCAFIADHYQEFIDTANSQVDIAGQWPTDTSVTHLKDMIFSNRIFIYYENTDFSLEQKGSLEALYRQKGLSIQFRGADYVWLHRDDHPPSRPELLTPNSILLPRATGSGLRITATKLSP